MGAWRGGGRQKGATTKSNRNMQFANQARWKPQHLLHVVHATHAVHDFLQVVQGLLLLRDHADKLLPSLVKPQGLRLAHLSHAVSRQGTVSRGLQQLEQHHTNRRTPMSSPK